MSMHTLVLVPFPDPTAKERTIKAFAAAHPTLQLRDADAVPSRFVADSAARAFAIVSAMHSSEVDVALPVFCFVVPLAQAVFIRDAVDLFLSIPVRVYAEEKVTGVSAALMGKDAVFAAELALVAPIDDSASSSTPGERDGDQESNAATGEQGDDDEYSDEA